MVDAIAKVLGEADSANAETFKKNASNYKSR